MTSLTDTQRALLDQLRVIKTKGLQDVALWEQRCKDQGKDIAVWIGVGGLVQSCGVVCDGQYVSNPYAHIGKRIRGVSVRTYHALERLGLVYCAKGYWVAL